jgi:hypothetical protein
MSSGGSDRRRTGCSLLSADDSDLKKDASSLMKLNK